MKKILYIVMIMPILIAIFVYFLAQKRINDNKIDNERLEKIEQSIEKLNLEFAILKSINEISKQNIEEIVEETEDLQENLKKEDIKPKEDQISNLKIEEKKIVEEKKIENTEPKTVEKTQNYYRELGYIKKIYSDSFGNKKLDIDYIELLSTEGCLPAIICFKNENRRIFSHIISENVDINILTLNYLPSGTNGQGLKFSDFWLMFNPDYPKESNYYNQFKEIPYWITIKNDKIISIDEQEIK